MQTLRDPEDEGPDVIDEGTMPLDDGVANEAPVIEPASSSAGPGLVVLDKDEAALEGSRARRQARKRRLKAKEEAQEDDEDAVRPNKKRFGHLQTAREVPVDFDIPSVGHSKQGYVGLADRERKFGFLVGNAMERLAELDRRGYELTEPAREVGNIAEVHSGRPSHAEAW